MFAAGRNAPGTRAGHASFYREKPMRKILALAVLALVLTGTAAAVISTVTATPAHADCTNPNC